VPAPFYALGAIASVQLGATVAKHLFAFLGPSGTVFLRVAFGACILLAIARPRWPRFDARQARTIVIFGLIIAGMNLCFYQAIARIPLGVAVTIEFIGPLGVAIVGSRKALDFAWAVMAAAGVALLSFSGGAVTTLGLLFALGAAAGWASYIVLGQRVGRLVPGRYRMPTRRRAVVVQRWGRDDTRPALRARRGRRVGILYRPGPAPGAAGARTI
jgi:inner membrane transporter RhtA